MSTDVTDAEIETLARRLLQNAGAEPDMLVQAGQPETFGTPNGMYFGVNPGAAVPLWRTYISTARTFLKEAKEQLVRDMPVELKLAQPGVIVSLSSAAGVVQETDLENEALTTSPIAEAAE